LTAEAAESAENYATTAMCFSKKTKVDFSALSAASAVKETIVQDLES
jgi:hypothetical protein